MTDNQFSTTRRTVLGLTGAGALTALAGCLGGVTVPAQADGNGNGTQSARTYRVTVANLTSGQPFTPPVVVAHQPSVELFSVGDPASEAIKELAENGNLAPLGELAESLTEVRGAAIAETPLVPGDLPASDMFPSWTTLELQTDASGAFLSFVSMLIGTNDGFTGLDTVPLPDQVNESRSYFAASFDAGTEENTEDYADMVPPAQALYGIDSDKEGTGMSNPDLAEDGVITPHGGIVGDGDLDPAVYGWDDPVALVHVERMA
ncbi:spondin domain-containing protein [Haloferax sp. DFSO52]|uniref:spondin domain-containing protein n=1 Tax=Haloferax sp. DFSO52 TaxID=3388505 RepID=UPI003A86F91D